MLRGSHDLIEIEIFFFHSLKGRLWMYSQCYTGFKAVKLKHKIKSLTLSYQCGLAEVMQVSFQKVSCALLPHLTSALHSSRFLCVLPHLKWQGSHSACTASHVQIHPGASK